MTRVCVHGLGYVGLPTAALFANEGFEVVGIDPDPDRRATLAAANPDFNEPALNTYVERGLTSERFDLRAEPTAGDYHLLCVPTPFDEDAGVADLSAIEAAATGLAPRLREGDTVVLESTVPPGTTAGFLRRQIERPDLEAGRDFSLAFCPETILPGAILDELTANDRIVGGIDEQSTESAAGLFEPLIQGTVHRAPDATTAEFAKLAQNTFRDVNIALANELAVVADDYGVDARDAFALANSHPRVSLLKPGPGVGGHCLPVDPLYFGQDSDAVDLVETAREVNDGMIEHVRDRLRESLGRLANKRIAVFGIAYKGNVADTRNSPGERFVDLLTERQALAADGGVRQSADVRVHDPLVEDAGVELTSRTEALDGADALVITTDHSQFETLDPGDLTELMRGRYVLDTKGLLDVSAWEANGFDVEQL
jgi:UDP-N-acetyl-D-mannosaminuronic acid dehydrogenase